MDREKFFVNIDFKSYQYFWYKFKHRAFQHFLDGLKNPKWILMFCLGRIQIFRSWGIYISKRSWKPTYQDTNSIFKEVNVDLVVEQLRSEGVYEGINLPQDRVLAIQEFSQSASYLGNAKTEFRFFLDEKDEAELRYQQKFLTAHHLNPSQHCKTIENVAEDPKLWEIAAKYLETKPILIETRLWWTFVPKEPVNKSLLLPYNFHYDLEDYRFIKFMFYLKNVNEYSGSHVCIKGSHNKKKLRDQLSLIRVTSEQEIFDYYGAEKVSTICGEAGSGFVEDFYCFHRGTLPILQDRLVLEVKFAMNKYERV